MRRRRSSNRDTRTPGRQQGRSNGHLSYSTFPSPPPICNRFDFSEFKGTFIKIKKTSSCHGEFSLRKHPKGRLKNLVNLTTFDVPRETIHFFFFLIINFGTRDKLFFITNEWNNANTYVLMGRTTVKPISPHAMAAALLSGKRTNTYAHAYVKSWSLWFEPRTYYKKITK